MKSFSKTILIILLLALSAANVSALSLWKYVGSGPAHNALTGAQFAQTCPFGIGICANQGTCSNIVNGRTCVYANGALQQGVTSAPTSCGTITGPNRIPCIGSNNPACVCPSATQSAPAPIPAYVPPPVVQRPTPAPVYIPPVPVYIPPAPQPFAPQQPPCPFGIGVCANQGTCSNIVNGRTCVYANGALQQGATSAPTSCGTITGPNRLACIGSNNPACVCMPGAAPIVPPPQIPPQRPINPFKPQQPFIPQIQQPTITPPLTTIPQQPRTCPAPFLGRVRPCQGAEANNPCNQGGFIYRNGRCTGVRTPPGLGNCATRADGSRCEKSDRNTNACVCPPCNNPAAKYACTTPAPAAPPANARPCTGRCFLRAESIGTRCPISQPFLEYENGRLAVVNNVISNCVSSPGPDFRTFCARPMPPNTAGPGVCPP